MNWFLQEIIDWSEVWAVAIPLAISLKRKRPNNFLKPVIAYLWIAFFLNLICDVIYKFQQPYFHVLLKVNTYFYNVHSIVRFILFSLFFIKLRQPYLQNLKKIMPVVYIIYILINFAFFEKFINYWYNKNGELNGSISSRIFSLEAALLLVYCLLYYLYKLHDDAIEIKKTPDFWIVMGLSIFVTFNFFYYLLYGSALKENLVLVDILWDYSNLTYLIFCIFIAKALYDTSGNRYKTNGPG